MFKNSIIGILLGILYFIWIDEFYWLSFISLTTIITFCVWAIEETINDFKRKLFQRKIKKEIAKTKIPQPRRPKQVS